MRKRHKSPLNPRQGAVQRSLISRRHFLGGMIGMGTATALGPVLEHRHGDRLSLHEATFYKPHDLAGERA